MALKVIKDGTTYEIKQDGSSQQPNYNGNNVSKIQVQQGGTLTTVWEYISVALNGTLNTLNNGNALTLTLTKRQGSGYESYENWYNNYTHNHFSQYSTFIKSIKGTLTLYDRNGTKYDKQISLVGDGTTTRYLYQTLELTNYNAEVVKVEVTVGTSQYTDYLEVKVKANDTADGAAFLLSSASQTFKITEITYICYSK